MKKTILGLLALCTCAFATEEVKDYSEFNYVSIGAMSASLNLYPELGSGKRIRIDLLGMDVNCGFGTLYTDHYVNLDVNGLYYNNLKDSYVGLGVSSKFLFSHIKTGYDVAFSPKVSFGKESLTKNNKKKFHEISLSIPHLSVKSDECVNAFPMFAYRFGVEF